MRVEIDWKRGYKKFTERRPWIAKITGWPVGEKPAVVWGVYNGDEDGGTLEISANPGDLVRWGHKTSAVARSVKKWGIVQPDGGVIECTEAKAHTAWKAKEDEKKSDY